MTPKKTAGRDTDQRGSGATLNTDWLTRAERGSTIGIRSVFWLTKLAGRRVARLLLRVIALYYLLFGRRARRASRQWLETVHGRDVSYREVYGHILRFCHVTLDRVFLLQGITHHFEVKRTGSEHLARLTEERRGAVLIGAHLGSFEAMRASAKWEDFTIRIVGHFQNAKMINALIKQLDPQAAARVMHVGDDPVEFALNVRKRLEQGDQIALLADRLGLNDKSVQVNFFGKPAVFPSGPFLLAATMRCPVYLVFGLYREPNRYELHCEPFADPIVLPRSNRKAALREAVSRYATRLEHYCRQAPDNWFNFFDFWQGADDVD